MPGMGGDEGNVGSRACALLLQGKLWRGEAEPRRERIRLAKLTPTAPNPPGHPGTTHGHKAGRGKGDKPGFGGTNWDFGGTNRDFGVSQVSGMG